MNKRSNLLRRVSTTHLACNLITYSDNNLLDLHLHISQATGANTDTTSHVLPKLSVLPSAYLIREIGSRYPTNVYDGNRLSLPILRQKMAQSQGMMFIDLPDGC
jgi:hypothetical protein